MDLALDCVLTATNERTAWKCTACRATNRATRTTCFTCNRPRVVVPQTAAARSQLLQPESTRRRAAKRRASPSVDGLVYTVREVAEILKIRTDKCYALVREGSLEAMYISSRHIRIPRVNLQRFIASRTAGGAGRATSITEGQMPDTPGAAIVENVNTSAEVVGQGCYDGTTMEQPTAAAEHDSDLALWVEAQTAALRTGRWADVDVANVTEALDAVISSNRREILRRLTLVAIHLLKVEFQTGEKTRFSVSTIRVQSREVEEILFESPSLRRELPGFIAKAYANARTDASDETGLPIGTFPQTPTAAFERALSAALAGDDFEF